MKNIALVALLIAVIAVPVLAANAKDVTGHDATYNGGVGQLLLDNCAGCHRANQIAPMSLLSYGETRPWARAIKSAIVKKEMPPWFADPRYGKFRNDKSLSQEQIDTIVAWVDAGAPEGEGTGPEVPLFSAEGWSHPSGREPDYVIEFPIDWHVGAMEEAPNFNLYTPLPFDEEIRVEAMEVRSGNIAATHHITTRLVNLPSGKKLGRGAAWPGGPLTDYVPVDDPDFDPEADKTERSSDAATRARGGGFGAYIPGTAARVTPSGQMRKIRADLFDYVVWNLHYQATGQEETARPEIGIWYAKDDATTVAETMVMREYTSEGKQLIAPPPLTPAERAALRKTRQIGQGLNPLLDPIPPGDADWTVTGIGAFQNDAVLQSLLVHAHVRGEDFTYVLTYPDGREQVVLRVPNYDFDWQFRYELDEPIEVPAGSTLKMIARYDNSPDNPLNPAPHKEVYWSEQSWDDMFLTTASYTEDAGNAGGE
ncbi:MAG: hypothetical protein VYE73_15150 [Acidobacteriota bacterium]|nr:hypothetical protein [Acidobacteriota bacterium]